jgi:transcriptional regulator with XRE-family HTH domain
MPTFLPFEFPTTADGQYIALVPDNRVLFYRREQLGLTQQQVADMANIPLRQYQRIEEGQSELAGNKMECGLAICAALLLDPYELVCPCAKQADPDTLKPLPAIDIKIPNIITEKKAGRKPIRRDVMRVYVNDSYYSMLIPCEVLTALGSPKCIQLRHKKAEHRIVILPIWDNIEETIRAEEGLDVPKSVYNERVLGIPGKDFINFVAEGLNWNDKVYKVECRLVKDSNENVMILIDLKTAEPSEDFECDPVIPWCLIDDDDEYLDDEDSGDNEDEEE